VTVRKTKSTAEAHKIGLKKIRAGATATQLEGLRALGEFFLRGSARPALPKTHGAVEPQPTPSSPERKSSR
jgi:hypothetical protein